MTEILIQAHNVADLLKESENFKRLSKLNSLIEQKYQQQIKNFNIQKEKFAQIMEEGGKYHPDYKQQAASLSQAKSELYSLSEVAEVINLEKLIQTEVDDILKNCAKIISPYIKTSDEIGLLREKGLCNANSKNGICG